jgi:hypothetical protein
MSDFIYNLQTLGQTGVTSFAGAFTNSGATITAAVRTMLGFVSSEITAKQPDAVAKMTTLIQATIQVVTTKTPEMKNAMYAMMDAMYNAVNEKSAQITNAGVITITTLVASINSQLWLFTDIGYNIDEGMARGIDANRSRVITAAVNMAMAAYRAACAALGVESPSKEFFKIGMYSDMGMANGFSNYSGLVEGSAEDVGNSALKGVSGAIIKISDYLDKNMDVTPTIRPVLDLSDVEEKARGISALMPGATGISVSSTAAKAQSSIPKGTELDEGSAANKAQQNTYNFTQNNYSPKPLSRIEIYRQTKNQFSAMKGLVNAK